MEGAQYLLTTTIISCNRANQTSMLPSVHADISRLKYDTSVKSPTHPTWQESLHLDQTTVLANEVGTAF